MQCVVRQVNMTKPRSRTYALGKAV